MASAGLEMQCKSDQPGVYEATFQLRGGGLMPYYRNVPLETPNAGVRRVVVVVHGLHRNAPGYFSYVVRAAESAGKLEETIVIAPHFKRRDEAPPGQLEWGEKWKEGGLSTDQGNLVPRRSSFEVVDRFLIALARRTSFPKLREIVVTGHSAGGQFVQRYAATSQIEPQLGGLPTRYVVANPSSYMYLNSRRWIGGRFRSPDEIVRHVTCPRWNHYKYGLRGRTGYVGLLSATQVRTQYPARRVTYLLGEADTGSQDLDQGCEANFQGRNRLRRGQLYFRFMNEFFPANRHKLRTVPGVGHTASGMYQSPVGQEVLFPPLPIVLPPPPGKR